MKKSRFNRIYLDFKIIQNVSGSLRFYWPSTLSVSVFINHERHLSNPSTFNFSFVFGPAISKHGSSGFVDTCPFRIFTMFKYSTSFHVSKRDLFHITEFRFHVFAIYWSHIQHLQNTDRHECRCPFFQNVQTINFQRIEMYKITLLKQCVCFVYALNYFRNK